LVDSRGAGSLPLTRAAAAGTGIDQPIWIADPRGDPGRRAGHRRVDGPGRHVVGAAALAARLDALRDQHGTVLLAYEWGPPSGLIAVNWFGTLDADQRTARVSTLLVSPDERRRGIARLLLKAATQAARSAGCGTLHLLASADEPTLRAFSEASGFDTLGMTFVRPLRKGGHREG
jgi:GNAT superfamily N-acetyltransferase